MPVLFFVQHLLTMCKILFYGPSPTLLTVVKSITVQCTYIIHSVSMIHGSRIII